MKIEAVTRLQSQAVLDITYEDYKKVVAALDPSYVAAFSFTVPSALKGLWTDLKEIGTLLKESAEVGWEHIVQAFKEKSVFTLLKGVGFSVAKLLKAVKVAASLLSNAVYRSLEDLRSVLVDNHTFQKMKIGERLEALDHILKSHPVLSKLSGLAVAGLLIWIWLHSSFLGHVDRDLDLVDTIVACLHGNFDLKELFTSPDGVHALACLLFGVATGGAGLTTYGFNHAEKFLSWIGSHSGNAFNLLLALFYAATKKLKMHIELTHVPKELHSSRSQDWYSKLHPEKKRKYKAKYPGTKFHSPERLIAP